MRTFLQLIKAAFPGAELPRNFIPFFPDRYLLPREAWEYVGGEKEFERLRKAYPETLRTYTRGEAGTATKYRLWELQDAIQEDARRQKKTAGSMAPRQHFKQQNARTMREEGQI